MVDRSSFTFVRRLSAEDLSILALEDALVAGHTCKVMILDGEVDLNSLRMSIASRLDRAPELRMRLHDFKGRPAWVLDPEIDLGAQVGIQPVLMPPDPAALRRIVAGLFRTRLDRSRPLWQLDVISELAGGGSALVWRIHHALADGSTAMRLATAALWDVMPEKPAQPTRPRAKSQRQGGWLAALTAVAREAPQPWIRSPFSGRITDKRAVAFASVRLDGLRHAAAVTDGATVNDAVLTVVAGGLRRWLEDAHGRLGKVRVKVPVSLHGMANGDPQDDGGNRDSFFCLDLPLETGDPRRRLAAVHDATRVRKQGHDAQYLDSLMRGFGHVPQLRRLAERALAHPRSFALNVSNVPGPREPVSILGVPVRALYPLAEIREHHALRVAVTSLGGALHFGFTADPSLIPHVDRLAHFTEAEAIALADGLPSV